jgi:hypothetical protein
MSPTPSCAAVADFSVNVSRHFAAIVRYYRKFYEDLNRSGAEPYRMTRLGAWAASRAPHVFYFFRNCNLAQYDLFMDLGSGDGIVSCVAGLFTRSIGIEIDPRLASTAATAARSLGLAGRVEFICGDYRDHRIERADCLYLYPDKPIDHVADRLGGWSGTVMVYGSHFPPQSLIPRLTRRCGMEQIVLYGKRK